MHMDGSPKTPRRYPRTSTVLRALASLTPPSPILSPSQLQSSAKWSSGEIPILLDFAVLCPDTSPSPRGAHQLVASLSTTTVETMGTFGPSRKARVGEDHDDLDWFASESSLSGLCDSSGDATVAGPALVESTLEVDVTPKPSSSSQSPCDGYYEHTYSPLEAASQFTISAYLHSSSVASVPRTLPHSPSGFPELGSDDPCVYSDKVTANGLALHIDIQNNDDELANAGGQSLLYKTGSQTFSTLPTPSFALLSPSPSMDIIGSRSLQFRSEHNTPFLEPRMSPLKDTCSASTYPSLSSTHSWLMVPDSAPCTPLLPHTAALSPSTPLQPSSKFASLPKKLSWLQHTTVTFSIDQEGFRAIHPTFCLAGYTPNTNTAEFIPPKRASFVFHHAALDSPPILRRVTVGGDETRDHISRQAALTLKANGVYTVQGSETSSLSPSGQKKQVTWKFAYLVDDRRAGATGRVMAGEKTFTPLSLSCAPTLLHPLQGKKVRLMHVVRKSVAPKLVAEKLAPPKCPHPPLDPGDSSLLLSGIRPRGWSVHRRARSHVPTAGENKKEVVRRPSVPRFFSAPGHSVHTSTRRPQEQPPPTTPLQRRRRASSAGERGRGGEFGRNRSFQFSGRAGDSASSFTPRHILPRAEICALLEGTESHQEEPGPHALCPPPPRRPVKSEMVP